MSSEIKTSLENKLAEYNIYVDGFSVIDFAFSKKFTDAIEAKQEAEPKKPATSEPPLPEKKDLPPIDIDEDLGEKEEGKEEESDEEKSE